jgi:hypothetical protein
MKVEIRISEGHTYTCYDKLGKPFVAVDYFGRNYGGGSPCDTEEDVNFAVKCAKTTIKREGDVPVVVDNRDCAGLKRWFKW